MELINLKINEKLKYNTNLIQVKDDGLYVGLDTIKNEIRSNIHNRSGARFTRIASPSMTNTRSASGNLDQNSRTIGSVFYPYAPYGKLLHISSKYKNYAIFQVIVPTWFETTDLTELTCVRYYLDSSRSVQTFKFTIIKPTTENKYFSYRIETTTNVTIDTIEVIDFAYQKTPTRTINLESHYPRLNQNNINIVYDRYVGGYVDTVSNLPVPITDIDFSGASLRYQKVPIRNK